MQYRGVGKFWSSLFNQRKGSVDQEEVQKHYRASIYITFWIRKGWRWKNYDELWWTMKNTQEFGNPRMRIWEVKRETLTIADLLRRSLLFSRLVRVDAAANIDGDGGEARRWRSSSSRGFARGRRWAREENEKAEACLFIRKRCEQTGAKIKEEPNKWLSNYTCTLILGKN